MKDFPKRAWIYTATVTLAAALVVAGIARGTPVDRDAAIGFGILFLLAELFPIRLPHASYSVSFVIAVAALVGLGPAEAAMAAAFGALDLSARRRSDWLGRMFFNGAQLTLSTALAGAAYAAFGGPVGHIGSSAFPEVLLPLLATAVTYFVANTGLVSVMVWLVHRVPIREVWHANYSSVMLSTFAFAVLGVVLGALYVEMGLLAVTVVLAPILVARGALKAAVEMDLAYEATLRSLVTAIEAKDAYTKGHAVRVSRLTTMIAREMGFSQRRVRALRIAALMHDVGKLVVSTAILTKPGKLTEEEYEHMKSHPVHGTDIVREIDFLRQSEAVVAVRHHHERMDGRGYPDNLFGDDVPLPARVVMVADAFDSMTSTRSYRMAKSVVDAMRELRRCAATQFDPVVINALDRAVRRHGWEPAPEAYKGEEIPRTGILVHAGS